MPTIASSPQTARDSALAEGRLAGRLIGLAFTAVVLAFLVGLFLF